MLDLTSKEVPRLYLFIRAVRLPFLIATFFPVTLGALEAAREGLFDPLLYILTLLGVSLIHFGLNAANDVFDFKLGADKVNLTPTPFSGGSRVLVEGLITERGMKLLFSICYLIGIGIGLYLALTRGFIPIISLTLLGFFLSFFYTAPPFKLAYRGLGEIAIFLGFGPTLVLGSYFVQAQRFTLEALYLSIPIGILIMLILYVNEIPDRPWDAKAGKRTLIVRLKKEAIVKGYYALIALVYVSIVIGSFIGLLPIYCLASLITVIWAPKVAKGIKENFENAYALIPTMAKHLKLYAFTALIISLSFVLDIVVKDLLL